MANGDGTDTCDYPGQNGPCGNPATEGSRCWIESHTVDPDEGPQAVTDGRGAPEGNDHALGNSGGAPEGNARAMKHGLHMSAERLLEVMDDRQREIFKHRFMEYRDNCMNDSQAMALAAGAVIREDLLHDLLERRMEEGSYERTAYTDNGQPYQQFTRDDIQALQGFFRELRLGLHYEGNSAQHTGGSTGHDNLDALVEGD